MAKKTWIKVKRGILEPKHRRQLGEAWYLYFYMLDLTNWADGVIYDWKDKDVASDLEIPLATLRDHRRKLEDGLYIKTTIKRYGLQIAITNWTNPREYSGDLYNEIQGDEITAPSIENKVQGDVQVDTKVDTKVDTQSDTQSNGGSAPLPLTHINTLSHNTDHIINTPLSKMFLSLTGIPIESIDEKKYVEGINALIDMNITPAILEDAIDNMLEKGYIITSPKSCISACGIELGKTRSKKKANQEDPYRYLKGEYGEFGSH